MTLDRSAHAGSATFGLPVRVGAEMVDQPQVCALDRLDQLTGRLDHHRRRQRPIELPVGVRVAGAALDRADGRAARRGTPIVPAARRGGRRRPTGSGSRSDRVLVAPRRRSNRRGEEHLLAGVGVPSGERQQWLQPVTCAGLSAGQEVIGAPAGRDLQASVAACARCDLYQPGRLLVQEAELQGAVALRRERPYEHPSVSEPQAAAQPFGRAVGAVSGAGFGGCGHRILLAQVWAHRPPVPPRARGCRRS